MGLVINTNIASLSAQRNISEAQAATNQAQERLSSGLRINSAADDAAGLAISERFTSQIRGLDQAVRNANDGVSLIQTAEGALDESQNVLQRIRELSVQSANGTFDSGNRATINAEVQQLVEELDRIAETTDFNGLNILDGSVGEIELQVGSEANQTISFEIGALDADSLGLGSTSVDLLGGENSLVADTVTLESSDILINGQEILETGETFDSSTDTLDELVNSINENVNGVTASTVVSNTATAVGDGVLSGTDELTVTLTNLDGGQSSITVRDTESLQELADSLNEQGGGLISANITDSGELNISAQNVTSFTITDSTGAGGTGLAGTSTASLALSSDNGDDITVTRGTTGTLDDLESLGFRENNEAGVIEGAAVGTGALEVGDLTINGVDVGASDAGLFNQIDAINDVRDQTGVTANAFTSVEIDTSSGTGAISSGSFSINGEQVTSGATLNTLVDNINALTDTTGVTATLSGQNLLLEGDVSQIAFGDASGGADSGAALGTILGGATVADGDGGILLRSDSGASISVELADAAAEAATGLLNANTTGEGRFGAAVSSIDVSTAAGAQRAIGVVDNALQNISDVRGDLGAINNRLDFTINNLTNVSENASASRSRIQDADFAAESAELSRAQVLQQAGTAILAQANAAPQQVLSLLN